MSNKKDILIITPLWDGAYEFFLEGKEEASGMPAFNNVLKRILKHDQIEKVFVLLLFSHHVDIVIPEKFRDKISVQLITGFGKQGELSVRNSLAQMMSTYLKVLRTGYSLIRKHNIGTIFGHSNISFLAGLLSMFTGIPNVRRLYGVSALSKSKHLPNWRMFLRHPFIYLSLALPAKAIIITNDGSRGDYYYNRFGNKKAKFIFELNGVDMKEAVNVEKPSFPQNEVFFSYISRICEFKRQKLLVETIHLLRQEGIKIPTYLVGQVSEQKYDDELKELIEKYDLGDQIIQVLGVSSKEVHQILSKSHLTFSLYHTSNLGNVFLEAMRVGAPMVAINCNNSLDFFPEDTYFQAKTDDPREIADLVKMALDNEEKRLSVAQKSKLFADQNLKTWESNAHYTLSQLVN